MRTLIGLGATLILTLIFLGIAISRGIIRSRIRAICLLGCAILAHLITLGIKNGVSYPEIAASLQNNIAGLAENDIWKMIDGSEALQNALTQIAGAVMAPLIYLLVFLILQILTLIVYGILMIFFGKKLKQTDADRRLRFPRIIGLALAQVLIVVFVFLTPIAFYSQIAGTAVSTVQNSEMLDEESVQTIESLNLSPDKESGFVKVYRVFGGNAVCKSLTKMKIEGEKTYLADEITVISELTEQVIQLKKAGSVSNYGDTEADTIEEMGETFGKSKLLSSLAGELIFQVTDKWSKGETFMNAGKPEVDGMLEPTLDVLIADFHQDSRSIAAISADFNTLSRIISTLARAEVLKNFDNQEELVNKLGSGDVIKSVIRILGENPTLKNLIPEFTNLGMRAIGNMLSLPENAEEVYETFIDDVTDSINEVLKKNVTNEEKAELLTDSLQKALDESGVDVELDRDSVSLYANAILAEFDGMTSVTDIDIREFFQVYAAVQEDLAQEGVSEPVSYLVPLAGSDSVFKSSLYAGKTMEELKKSTGAGMLAKITVEIVKESKNAADDDAFRETVKNIVEKHTDAFAEATGKTTLAETVKTGMQNADIKIDSISENDLKATASINAESFPTVIVTIEVLLVDPDEVAKELTGDTLEKEAEAINSLFNTASTLKDKLPDGQSLDSLTDIAEEIGTILNTLNNTTTFGEEKTASLVTAVFQSEQVAETLNLDLKEATDLARAATDKAEGEAVNYAETMISVSHGAEIAKKIGDAEGNITEEDIREMLQDMTPQTANMMCVYITPERMASYGIDADKSESSALVLQNLFAEMGNKERYRDRYDEQTQAIAKMFDVAVAASRDTVDDALFNYGEVHGRLNMTASETVETVLKAEMVCNAVVDSVMENGVVKEGMFNPFGVKIAESSADYQECRSAIEKYYNDHKNEQENLKAELTAIAALFGVSDLNLD